MKPGDLARVRSADGHNEVLLMPFAGLPAIILRADSIVMYVREFDPEDDRSGNLGYPGNTTRSVVLFRDTLCWAWTDELWGVDEDG